ncbi:MAG: DUF123 domain-containing protein [Anaerolineae bacterium]
MGLAGELVDFGAHQPGLGAEPAPGTLTAMGEPDNRRWPAAPGTYALILEAREPHIVWAGRLGWLQVTPGRYLYVGSALGPGGLRARLQRHFRPQKRLHWHIDALTAVLPIVRVITAPGQERLECTWARRIAALPGVTVPWPGFGSSDCRAGCRAHLLRLPDHLDWGNEITLSAQKDMAEGPRDMVQELLGAIAVGDDEAAERAAQALTARRDLLPALRPLLVEGDADRRWWAVRTLALIGGPEAEAAAAQRLSDPDEATRCAAALALGQLRAVSAIPALAGLLADPSGWVRDSAGDALAMIGEPALPALLAALADPRNGVRVRAAAALRKTVTSRLAGLATGSYPPAFWPAINALFLALNDANRLVRHNAYEALDQLGLLETVWVAS